MSHHFKVHIHRLSGSFSLAIQRPSLACNVDPNTTRLLPFRLTLDVSRISSGRPGAFACIHDSPPPPGMRHVRTHVGGGFFVSVAPEDLTPHAVPAATASPATPGHRLDHPLRTEAHARRCAWRQPVAVTPSSSPHLSPADQLASITAATGWAITALVFTWADGSRSGFAHSHKMVRLPLDAKLWHGHGSTVIRDVQPGEYVTRLSGVNSRAEDLGNSAYPAQRIALSMSSGRVIRIDGTHRGWDGSSFEADVPASQVLRALSFRNGTFERLVLSPRRARKSDRIAPVKQFLLRFAAIFALAMIISRVLAACRLER